jgi:YcxB-like protein
MASVDPGAEFSLTYEVQPDDLGEILAAEPEIRRLRTRAAFSTVLLALFGAVLTAFTVVAELNSVAERSSGVTGWIYVVDVVLWGIVFWGSFIIWRLSPKGLARRGWRVSVRLHGRHHDKVGPRGIASTEPDGTQALIPWTSIDRIRETKRAFHLIDHHGAVRVALPKRGLDSPDLLPALREFLIHSTGGQPLAVTPGAAAGEPMP